MVNALSSIATRMFTCIFDVTKFPFDEHLCIIRLEGWQFESFGYQLKIDSVKNEVPLNWQFLDLFYYTEHEQWELIAEESVIKEKMDEDKHIYISIEVKIRRRYFFYSVFLIYPNILLYIMTAFAFILPAESGEKVSFATTLLLAQIVNTGTMLTVFPRSSLRLPVLVYFSAISTLQLSFICFCAIIVVKVHFSQGTVGSNRFAKNVISSRFIPILGFKMYKKATITYQVSPPNLSQESTGTQSTEQENKQETESHPEIKSSEEFQATFDETQFIRIRFALVLDRFFMILHLVSMTAVTLWFLIDISY
ncbi:acetylcholine receptor subunit beta-type acr-3-like isoform X2 [Symsagittifera roscoffensis]